MKNNLEKLKTKKLLYDKESQALIESFSFVEKEIELMDSLKRNEGWKVMEKKIREELQLRIKELVKDDLVIKTLLAILVTGDTKSMSKNLNEEISKLLPES